MCGDVCGSGGGGGGNDGWDDGFMCTCKLSGIHYFIIYAHFDLNQSFLIITTILHILYIY